MEEYKINWKKLSELNEENEAPFAIVDISGTKGIFFFMWHNKACIEWDGDVYAVPDHKVWRLSDHSLEVSNDTKNAVLKIDNVLENMKTNKLMTIVKHESSCLGTEEMQKMQKTIDELKEENLSLKIKLHNIKIEKLTNST